jgi:flagellar biosynthetic protein FlhB
MADDESGERTEQATDSKREEFRKRGQVAQTKELASALLLMAAAGCIYAFSRFSFEQFSEIFRYSLGPDLVYMIREGSFLKALEFSAGKAVLMMTPVLGIAFILGIASTLLQVGFLQVEDAITPDINKLSPEQGIKRIFSMRALIEGVKSILKLVFIGFVVYLVLRSEINAIPRLMEADVESIVKYLGSVVMKMLFVVGLLMLVIALADYFFIRLDLEKQMMMTKQEVKEEMKQREGDPLIKSRIRRIQREASRKRMMAEIPNADVVITNPTHIAVVLKYGDNLPAPQLVAVGADLIAEKIKVIARENNIPIVENKPLARTIYKTMKLGQVIPRELFVAVAEVLSYVYKLKKKTFARS